jgi:nitrogenase-associated protein
VATIIFYEKPGCGGNARQRRVLEAAGHTIVARNLLTEPWTAAALNDFFGETPVQSWFNTAAPAVKSGAIDPGTIDAASALALMLANPLLIKRPLLEVDGVRQAGFDVERIRAWIGLDVAPAVDTNVSGCVRPEASTPCPAPARQPQRQDA